MVSRQNAEQQFAIRNFILDHLADDDTSIIERACDYFSVSRTSIDKQLQQLVDDELITCTKQRPKTYVLGPIREQTKHYPIDDNLSAQTIWDSDFAPILNDTSPALQQACAFAAYAILDNSLRHAHAKNIYIYLRYTQKDIMLCFRDDGLGLLSTLQKHNPLAQPKLQWLELSKGHYSCDPKQLDGNSLCLCSLLFDDFCIDTGTEHFSRRAQDSFLPLLDDGRDDHHTIVRLSIPTDCQPDLEQTQQQLAQGLVQIPLHLLQRGKMALSRPLAELALHRIEHAKLIEFDFNSVNKIASTFAEALFIDFANAHPDIEIRYINANPIIEKQIQSTLLKTQETS